LIEILKKIDLMTLHFEEILKLLKKESDALVIAMTLAMYCAVLLKGGHNHNEIGIDDLYIENKVFHLSPKGTLIIEKHSPGCVLLSAITANLASKQNLKTACHTSKICKETYLSSNKTKLSSHYV
jgi:hydroxymethylpyrimidine/phosphomethylpyrimidine kinase